MTPNSAIWPRRAFTSIVLCRTNKSRVRCNINTACCSAVLMGTKRIVGRVDPVQLEDPLGDVQTDCGNLHVERLLQLVTLNGPSLAHRCRQGSSTASDFDH